MIQWYKKHPDYLLRETKALSQDLNYKLLYLFRNNLLVSHGNIIVRLDKIYRFYFLIVYTNAAPYALPLFFPLKNVLTEQQVKDISLLQEEQVFSAIKDDIMFHYHLRHQNASGALCILEWDNLDDGVKFYGITTILKRVKDWCKGIVTNKFPPDSEEVEFCAHFNYVDNHLHFFYPDNFLQHDLLEGEAYGTLYTTVPKGIYFDRDHHNYVGSLLIGTRKNGLYHTSENTFPAVFKEAGVHNELDLYQKRDAIRRLVDEKTLIKIYWFNIEKEPAPFHHFEDLITIIGEGDREQGKNRMIPLCLDDVKLKPEQFFIALRFPNRKSILEFQLFRVAKVEDSSVRGSLVCHTKEEIFDYLIADYTKIYAVRSGNFSDDNFHQRNAGRANRNQLMTKVVNMIGVGALGSEIADCIAKAGTGYLCLIDNQPMKIQNSVRHLVGIDYSGVMKVDAVKNMIALHNPFVHVQCIVANINSIDLNDFFLEESLSISTIADDNTEAFFNERAVIANKIVYYARALRGGNVARIFRVIPGQDACFHCLHLYRNERKIFITIPEDPNLPTLRNECNNPIRPASAADLKLISSLTSRIILEEMQQGYSDSNHWMWSTESLEPLQPYQLHKQTIPPHPMCYYCNINYKAEICIKKKELEFIQSLVANNPKIETGGVLAGYIDEKSNFQITNASAPGPNATCTPTKFEKDVEYCQHFLDQLSMQWDGKIFYLGEWHSHPNKNNKPSNTDLKSLTDISYQKEYVTDKPIMIILSDEGDPSCTVHPMGKRYYFSKLSVLNT